MKIKLLCVGKTSFDFVDNGNEMYIKRLQKMLSFEMQTIPDIRNTKKMPVNEIKSKEAGALMKYIKPEDKLCLLDEAGRSFSSIDFAKQISNDILAGTKQLIFVVGGAYGFAQTMYNRADYKVSLSKMTFSHQIIRVIFLEQLYRAFTIINRIPYHNQ